VSSPAQQQSAQSQSITIHSPLYAEPYTLPDDLQGIESWRVLGRPADCVKVALTAGVFGDWKPDIVLSGINAGPNTGQSIHYSGTVGAAREANINGYPSIALSLSFPEKEGIWHYQWAAEQTVQFLEKIRECRLLEKCPNLFRDVCININFPNRPFSDVKGWKVTKQGSSGFKVYCWLLLSVVYCPGAVCV